MHLPLTISNEVSAHFAPHINSVAFVYTGGLKDITVEQLNAMNRAIHAAIIEEGTYHLHQFSIPDAGIIKKGEIIYPLRFMSGNPNTTREHLVAMLEYVRGIGRKIQEES